VVVVLGRRRWPVVAFGLAWTGLVLLPVSNLLVPTGVLLAERSLFLPSVGAMLALAAAVWGALESASSTVPGRRSLRSSAGPLRALGLVVVLLLGVARSATRGPVWRDDATLFASGVHDGPDDYFTHFLEARALARAGRSAEAERELRTAIRLAPDDPRLYAFLGWHDLQAGDCDAATPAFRQALALWPMSYEARAGLVTCLLHAGDYAEARSLSIVAVASGGHQAFFRRALVAADSARRADSLQHHGDGA
jgi:Tfp pilus assembly protein PilF